LLAGFESLHNHDAESIRHLYDNVPASNFSQDILSSCPTALAVMRTTGLAWSDLGEPQRVFSVTPAAAAMPALASVF
jgi:hypothetical protein